MERRRFLGLLAGGASTVLVSGLAGCNHYYDDDYAYGSPYYRGSAYNDPWYEYYYYPYSNVYFHAGSGYYWYPYRSSWRRVRRLPSHIYIYPADRRSIYIHDRNPYEHNGDHRRRYGRGDGYWADRRQDRRELARLREQEERDLMEYHRRLQADRRRGEGFNRRRESEPGGVSDEEPGGLSEQDFRRWREREETRRGRPVSDEEIRRWQERQQAERQRRARTENRERRRVERETEQQERRARQELRAQERQAERERRVERQQAREVQRRQQAGERRAQAAQEQVERQQARKVQRQQQAEERRAQAAQERPRRQQAQERPSGQNDRRRPPDETGRNGNPQIPLNQVIPGQGK